MMNPKPFVCVIPLPVAMLDLRKKSKNRISRRRNRYGKQHRFDEIAGKMSPKEMRESGL
jgi:hypothetical protein